MIAILIAHFLSSSSLTPKQGAIFLTFVGVVSDLVWKMFDETPVNWMSTIASIPGLFLFYWPYMYLLKQYNYNLLAYFLILLGYGSAVTYLLCLFHSVFPAT